MITKLPRWVWLSTGLLAFMAGTMNVVGFLSFDPQAVTHLTGTTSQVAMALAHHDAALAQHLLAIIAAFVFGAMLSGLLLRHTALRLGRSYGLTLTLEAALLIAAVPLLSRGDALGLYLTGAACGLQNAMTTTYSGTVLRTSHVTGMFTDLGIALGHLIRGAGVDRRRLHLCLIVITGFFTGGYAGASAFQSVRYAALYLPATMALLFAAAYTVYRWRKRRRVDRSAREPEAQ